MKLQEGGHARYVVAKRGMPGFVLMQCCNECGDSGQYVFSQSSRFSLHRSCRGAETTKYTKLSLVSESGLATIRLENFSNNEEVSNHAKILNGEILSDNWETCDSEFKHDGKTAVARQP